MTETTETGEENGDSCEQASIAMTTATADAMVAVEICGDEDESAEDLVPVLREVLDAGKEAGSTSRKIGFE